MLTNGMGTIGVGTRYALWEGDAGRVPANGPLNLEFTMISHRTIRATLSGLILIVVSACSGDTTGTNAKSVSLSFASRIKAAPSIVAGNGVSLMTQTAGGNTLVINHAQVVLSKIELASTTTAVCTDDNLSDAAECEELKAEPAVVDLPTGATVVQSLVSTVPPGTYTDFEGKVRVVQSSDQGGAAFLANSANAGFVGASVHVDGTWQVGAGAPVAFTCNSTANAELELAFATPLVVNGTAGLNITVNVDLSSWFLDGSKNLVDPTSGICGGVNASMVDHNIHQSFEAFEDSNKDGIDDNTQH